MPDIQEEVAIPTMSQVTDLLLQAAGHLGTIAGAQINGVNTVEEFARQVDAEYARVSQHIGWLASHLADLANNPRPSPESYSAKAG